MTRGSRIAVVVGGVVIVAVIVAVVLAWPRTAEASAELDDGGPTGTTGGIVGQPRTIELEAGANIDALEASTPAANVSATVGASGG